VPAYGELRTFAVERIRRVSRQEETLSLIPELDADTFKHSLGAYRTTGAATSKIQIRFHPRLAPYVRERASIRCAPPVRFSAGRRSLK
jgi:hypothetical protein